MQVHTSSAQEWFLHIHAYRWEKNVFHARPLGSQEISPSLHDGQNIPAQRELTVSRQRAPSVFQQRTAVTCYTAEDRLSEWRLRHVI